MLAKDSRRTLVAEEVIGCTGFHRSTHFVLWKMFPFLYRYGLWGQTSILWPKSSSKCLPISQKGTCFKGFIDFLKKCPVSLTVCVCVLTPMPTEANREQLPDPIAGFQALVLWENNKRSWPLSHHLSSLRAFAFKIRTPANMRMFLPLPIGDYF